MLQFFQTCMGRDFFQGTVPRVVRALETIASNYDHNLAERVAVLELALSLPEDGSHSCKDGFSFLLGRDKTSCMYKVTFPTAKDSLLEEYLDHSAESEVLSYTAIPATTIAQLVLNHGGLV